MVTFCQFRIVFKDMQKLWYIIFLIGLFCSCQSDAATEKIDPKERLVFTDSVNLNYANTYLKFNSFGLFDTVYRSYYVDMCAAPNEYITFSNSDYFCEDTFDVIRQCACCDVGCQRLEDCDAICSYRRVTKKRRRL